MTAKRRRPTVVASVSVPEATVVTIPPNLGRTLMWVLGTAATVTAVWVAILIIRDHSNSAEKDHDSQFVKKDTLEKHQQEDIQSITKMANAVNQLATNAEVGRQYLLASNKEIKASVADLALTICRQNNPKDANNVCRPQDTALQRAITDATQQAQIANSASTKAAVTVETPVPVPTK